MHRAACTPVRVHAHDHGAPHLPCPQLIVSSARLIMSSRRRGRRHASQYLRLSRRGYLIWLQVRRRSIAQPSTDVDVLGPHAGGVALPAHPVEHRVQRRIGMRALTEARYRVPQGSSCLGKYGRGAQPSPYFPSLPGGERGARRNATARASGRESRRVAGLTACASVQQSLEENGFTPTRTRLDPATLATDS
jgi:hypothetical protein